jgi:hypothetical protein
MEARDHDVDDPSEVVGALRALHGHAGEGASFIERIFGTPTFFRLWLAQALSSLAILILANRLGAGAPGALVGAGDGRTHRSPLLPVRGGRGADRPDGPQAGDGRLDAGAGVGGGVAAVRRFGHRPRVRVTGARAGHAVLLAGQGGHGPQPGARRQAGDRQLARAGRRLRHLSPGGRPVRSAGGGGRVARRHRRLRHPAHQPGGRRVLRQRRLLLGRGADHLSASHSPRPHPHSRGPRPDRPGPGLQGGQEGWHYAFITPVVRAVNVASRAGSSAAAC